MNGQQSEGDKEMQPVDEKQQIFQQNEGVRYLEARKIRKCVKRRKQLKVCENLKGREKGKE